ncbi:TonB-dependent siderophore receptor [Amaricoccus sp.]|uniref:TonB-dependent receptor plug domain-containing protein n=1 Tax=Amaricoccus sp. TaxID=1872485 RepID=UPI001B575CC9|nr:TonB-dependent receptor [Amaricoccus sp.]MBP7003271.1 TonB-dependent receptor [Amaricoccus sp.]
MRPFILAVALPGVALPLAVAAQTAPSDLVLNPITITANRTPTEVSRSGSSVSILDEAQMSSDGRPFVLQQIRDLPGVTVGQNGPAGSTSSFSVRGATPQYVKVEVDGIEISDPSGTQVAPSLSGLLVDDASRVEVLKGSQSALYGGQAVGGVISVTSPRPTEPGFQNSLLLEGGSYSTFRGAYTLTGMTDKAEFALTGARLQSDGFSAAEELDGNDEDDDYRTTRLSGSGRFHLTGQADLFAAGFWQRQDGNFDNGAGAGQDADNPYETDTWGLRGGADFTTDAGLTNTLALTYYDVDRDTTQFGTQSTFKGHRTKAEYLGGWDVSETVGLQYGADWTREESESTWDASAENWIAGAWLQGTWTPAEALVFNAAFRADDHSEFGYYPTARATFAWLATPETTIHGALANGFRAPSNYELFSLYGNPNLQPEESVSADIGVSRRFADRGEVGATLFWLEIEDLIEFESLSAAPWGRYVQTNGTTRSRGLELSGQWAFNELFALRGAYTWTDTETPDGTPINRAPKHDLSLTATGAYKRLSYDLGANFIWDYVDDSAIDFLSGDVIQSEGWTRDFVVVNARVAYAVTEAAEIYVRAENLFDEQYQTARGYGTSDRAFYAGVTARF